MMKGLAIYLVVMGHVIAMGVREIDHTFLFKAIGCVHMPLFFFISGWFSFRTDKVTIDLRLPSLWKRFLQLMVPLAVVPTLWVWYFPHSGIESPLDGNLADLWCDPMKKGFWFTLCLFEISLLFTAVFPLLKRWKGVWADVGISAVVWVALCAADYATGPDSRAANILGMGKLASFWLPFMAGFIASRHREGFLKATASGTWVTVAIAVAVPTLYFCCYPWEFEWLTNALPGVKYLVAGLLHISLAVIAIAVVRPWSERAFSPDATRFTATVAGVWTLLGRKSLAIYLLHYFFLFPMGICRETLLGFNVGFVPMTVFSFVTAGCIIGIVLIADALISKSPLLALLLTGDVPKSLVAPRKAVA